VVSAGNQTLLAQENIFANLTINKTFLEKPYFLHQLKEENGGGQKSFVLSDCFFILL
jgi:hypothetical protein